MVLFSVVSAAILFAAGVTSTDITQTTTVVDGVIPSGDSVIVELGGLLEIDDTTGVIISSLAVKHDGQFYYRTNESTASLEIDSIVNDGFILVDTSEVTIVSANLGTKLQNTGDVVVYGQYLNAKMDLQTNDGNLTFYGTGGSLTLSNGTNNGNICFRHQAAVYIYPDGEGCIALSGATLYYEYPQANFNPTIVFEEQSQFEMVVGNHESHWKFVQFGGGHEITIPLDGYTSYSYDDTTGILTIDLDYAFTIDLGLGYDESLFVFSENGAFLYMYYGADVPDGANTGGCSCVLIETPPPEDVNSSTESNKSSGTEENSSSFTSESSSSEISSTTESSTIEGSFSTPQSSSTIVSSTTSSTITSSSSLTSSTTSKSISCTNKPAKSTTKPTKPTRGPTKPSTRPIIPPYPTLCNEPRDNRHKDFCDCIDKSFGNKGHNDGNDNGNKPGNKQLGNNQPGNGKGTGNKPGNKQNNNKDNDQGKESKGNDQNNQNNQGKNNGNSNNVKGNDQGKGNGNNSNQDKGNENNKSNGHKRDVVSENSSSSIPLPLYGLVATLVLSLISM